MKELIEYAFGRNLNEALECGNGTRVGGGYTVMNHRRAAGVNNRAAN